VSRGRLVAAALAAYLLALFVGLPAERLRSPLEAMLPGTRLGPLHGHPLSGRAQGATLGGLAVDGLTWRWRPLALLTGRLGLDVEVLAGPTRATVELARSFAGQFVVDRLDGELDLAWLGTALPAPAFDASGRVVVEGVELALGSDGWPRSAQGRLELRDGALRAPLALRIGAADGTLQVNDEDHLEIAFRMLPGSPMEGDGRVQLATDGRYSLAANLAPGQAADVATRELLRMAGPAQPGGRVHVALEGALR
jgi:general secretion pathway protein N